MIRRKPTVKMQECAFLILSAERLIKMKNKAIDDGKAFDWGKASKDYAKYRDIYPEAFYEQIADLGLCLKGQTVLDLGTGTGVLPRNMYKFGAKFTGADISENQIKEAKRLSDEVGMKIDYVVSSAENVSFPNRSFDVVTASQCFMYFDTAVVLPKIHDMLKDNGHFLISFMSWLPEESEIAKESEELVLKYNPFWTGGHMKRKALDIPEWSKELFEVENVISLDFNLRFSRESWHGRMKACRGIGASSLSAAEIASWEKEHLAYLATLPETFDIPHYTTMLNVRKRS